MLSIKPALDARIARSLRADHITSCFDNPRFECSVALMEYILQRNHSNVVYITFDSTALFFQNHVTHI